MNITVLFKDNDSETIENLLNSVTRHNLKLAPILEVYSPCLIIYRNKLARAMILEVKINSLYVDLVDYGIREFVPRTNIFEVPDVYVYSNFFFFFLCIKYKFYIYF